MSYTPVTAVKALFALTMKNARGISPHDIPGGLGRLPGNECRNEGYSWN